MENRGHWIYLDGNSFSVLQSLPSSSWKHLGSQMMTFWILIGILRGQFVSHLPPFHLPPQPPPAPGPDTTADQD